MPLIIGTISDRRLLRDVLRKHAVHGVMHIAAKKQASESVTNPLLYYRENVEGLIAVLDVCQSEGVQHFVFSSSAATNGMPDVDLVTENTPCAPLTPYGESKLIGEWLVTGPRGRLRREDPNRVGLSGRTRPRRHNRERVGSVAASPLTVRRAAGGCGRHEDTPVNALRARDVSPRRVGRVSGLVDVGPCLFLECQIR